MNEESKPVIWPYLILLTGLFAFVAAAPRSWQHPPLETVADEPASRAVNAPSKEALVRESSGKKAAVERLPAPTDAGDVPSSNREPAIGDGIQAIATAEPELPADLISETAAPAPADTKLQDPTAAERAKAPELLLAKREDRENPVAEPVAEESGSAQATVEPPLEKSRLPQILRRPRRAKVQHPVAYARSSRMWVEPVALLDQLDELACECDAGQWAAQAAELIRQLCHTEEIHSPQTRLALKRMRDLIEPTHPLLVIAEHTPKKGDVRRLRYAVLRRLDFWELVPELTQPPLSNPAGPAISLSSSRRTATLDARVARLLSHLERFEQTGLTDDGRDLAADLMQIVPDDEKLAARSRRSLDWNYRNSNLRVVVSGDLLNRLVPEQPAVEMPVNDRILGVPTRGWSTSTARVSVQLLPDGRSLRFALEARGIVFARTTSRREPVTLHSNSDSAFIARKQFELSSAGLKTWPTTAEVSNSSRLRSVETDYDDVPILGPIVEGIARAKHAETEPAVRRVAKRKVAARVQEELDTALEPRLKQARKTYQDRVVAPLGRLQLDCSVIEMLTTEARVTSRLRLASGEQLAACTPRPMALSDSLASVQIHQSVVNNVCDRLDLDGKTFNLPDLQRHLTEAFQLSPEALPEEYPADLRISFAKRDALTTRFDGGRIELTLCVTELRKFPKTWRDFQVRVYYRPQVRGLDLRMVRDGTVQLRGEHFGHEPQIALRGIFSKVFSHDREFALVDPKVQSDARLGGLAITQCVVTDGWIGLSLGSGALRQAQRTVGPLY